VDLSSDRLLIIIILLLLLLLLLCGVERSYYRCCLYTKRIYQNTVKCGQSDPLSQSNVLVLVRTLSCGMNQASSSSSRRVLPHSCRRFRLQILECGGPSVCRSDRQPGRANRLVAPQPSTIRVSHTAEYQLRLSIGNRMSNHT
jgi:hypothetical protein